MNLSIRGVVRAATEINEQVLRVVSSGKLPAPEALTGTEPSIRALARRLEQSVIPLLVSLKAHGVTLGNLPTRSRRAAEWMLFLLAEDHLLQHVRATLTLYRQCMSFRKPDAKVRVYLFHHSYLYRASHRDGILKLDVNEGFLNAPPEMLALLAELGAKGKSAARLRSRLQQFAGTEAFQQVQAAMNGRQPANYLEPEARGSHYHLREVFDRVNREYFDGQQTVPHLNWSSSPTFRKFGHYHPATDSIQISLALDLPEIPVYVLDYVMYHEMLHRSLGIEEINGRNYVHTGEFRQLAEKFSRKQAAEQILNRLARLA